MKRLLTILLIIMMLGTGVIYGEEEIPQEGPTDTAPTVESAPSDFCVRIPAGETTEEVRMQRIGEENWIFLPSSADLTGLVLEADGEEMTLSYGASAVTAGGGQQTDLTRLYTDEPTDGVYRVGVDWNGGFFYLNLMHSQHLASLFLTSEDPEEKGRAWVEASPDKSHKAKGRMSLLGPEGTPVYEGNLKQIKGRGNSTWLEPKKPYQIKLEESIDLMETGDPREQNQTWVLLTNYSDETLLANRVMFDLAADLGIRYTPNCRPVDLYYDGEYRGSYLLSEKTEVTEGRVDVRDLGSVIEEDNRRVGDLDDLPTVIGSNRLGNEYQYVRGLKTPKDMSGGYLLELDYEDRAREEKSWFSTSDGYYLTVKSPEYAPKQVMDYISSSFQELENAVDGGGTDRVSGKKLSEIADLKSLAEFFLVEEISYDKDVYVSSTYLYKHAGDDLFYAGPVWDFDAILGRDGSEVGFEGFFAGNTSVGHKLLQLPVFREEAQKVYEERFDALMGCLLDGRSVETDRLKPLEAYREEMAASERMDEVLWPGIWENGKRDYREAIEEWEGLLRAHNDWLREEISAWDEDTQIPYFFIDVSPRDWFAEGVSFVFEEGIMNGINEFQFAPHRPITRAMAVTILYRVDGQNGERSAITYTDVPENTWYTSAVDWAGQQGIAIGYEDGSFRPEQEISREELAVMLYRYYEMGEGGSESTRSRSLEGISPISSFIDSDQVSEWARNAMAWALDSGVLNGVGGNRLDPKGTAQRCQAAVILQRLLTNGA